jgi:uncharacterized membrane protein
LSTKALFPDRLNSPFSKFMGLFFACLFLLYPYLVYKGMASGMGWLPPVIFSGVCAYRAWNSQKLTSRLLNAILAITFLLGAFYAQGITAKIAPVFVQLMLMYFFGYALLDSKQPTFIEKVVRLQFPESPPAISQYCRRLTQIWTAFFASNALLCALLAVWGSDYWWALYNGVGIYLLIGLLTLGEYVYRRIHFADLSILHQGIPDPKATLKAMFINGRKIYLDTMER